jgi:hypothetical protein
MGGGNSRIDAQARSELVACHTRLIKRWRALEQCASLAPTDSVEGELTSLAAEERSMAERLATALAEAGVPAPRAHEEPPSLAGNNHWARLTRSLDDHRAARRNFLELSIRLSDIDRQLANVLRDLCAEEVAHLERLRDMIARADPQALD